MKDKNSLCFVPTGTPVTVKSINASGRKQNLRLPEKRWKRLFAITNKKAPPKAVLNKTVIMFLVKRHSIFYAVSLFCLSDDIGSMPTKS